MKRSTASWTTAVAASALLALPVGSWAQQPTPSTTPRQTTGAPAPQTPGAEMKQGSANEHLRQAQSALADIPETSLTGTTKTRVAELKRHLNALEQAAQKPASGTSARSASWTSDAAAADRILSELLDPASTTGATTPAPTGTTGSTATAPKTTTGGKSSASMTLDDTARTKLQEVRTQITAFAAAMGAGSTPKSPSTSSDDPTSPASASAANPTRSIASAPEPTPAAVPTGTSGTTPAPGRPAQTQVTPADPAAPAQPPTQSPAQPPTATPETPSPTPSQQVDADTVKRHLTNARDTLSQMTQLPGAAQLTGDARTQVSQLISNFNELITTNVDWRAAYTKLQGNLTALVGDQRADESPATPAAGAAGAVGTSGTVSLDPAIRAKLIEFRTHLAEFEKAAGGSGTPPAKEPAAQPEPSAATSASASSTSSASPAPSAGATATPSAATTASTTNAPPSPAATTGSTAETPTAAGTSGTGTPMPAASEQSTKPSTSGRDSAQAAQGHRAAMTHIEAIEAILNGGSPSSTSGATAGKTTKPGTLDGAQIEAIRNHLAQLRQELDKSDR